MKLSYGSLNLIVGSGFYAYEEDECLNITPFERDAAVTISSVRRTNGGDVTENDLKRFVEKENLEKMEISSVSLTGANGFKVVGFDNGGTYWLKWFLKNGSVIAFVTYNAFERLPSEEIEVNEMIDSIDIIVKN